MGGKEIEEIQERQKPDCPLIGQNGNIFCLMGVASRTLKGNGMKAEADEMMERVTSSHSYEEALGVICEYVSPVSINEYDEPEEGMNM